MSAVPGRDFARLALSFARSRGSVTDALQFAERSYGVAGPVAAILRAAVTSGSISDAVWAEPLVPYQIVGSEFVETLRPRTLIGRMAGLRRVPMKAKIPRSTSGISAGWVGERSPISVRAMSLDTITLEPLQMAALCVVSDELLKMSDPAAELVLRNDLIAACVQAADEAFISDTIGELGVSAAGICYNAETVASSGSSHDAIASDLRKLFDILGDNGIQLRAPYLCCTPRTAVGLSLMRGSTGTPVWPEVTAQGGMLAGVPLLVSTAVAEAVSAEELAA